MSVPEQPDGIEYDSRDLPDAHRAARRVRAYIEGAGDGLYDTSDPGDGHPRPLYARDLQALVNLAQQEQTQSAELLLLLGLVQQARDFGHVHELLDEFAKAPDFPVCPPSAVLQSPAGGEAGGEK